MTFGFPSNIAYALVFPLLLGACSNADEESRNVLGKMVRKTTWKSSPAVFIAHAGGVIDLQTYTNSREAIQNSIDDGKKLIEIDLIETSDGHLVGGHDWVHFKMITNYEGENDDSPLSLEQFQNSVILERYTPITLSEISTLFAEYSDLILVIDKSNNFDLILKEFAHHERLIVEVFGEEAYKASKRKGILFPAFNTEFLEEQLKFIDSNDIKIVTFSTAHLKNKATLDIAVDFYSRGISSMVYSTSDEQFISEHLGRSATMFYTDFWSLAEKRCVNPSPDACLSQF